MLEYRDVEVPASVRREAVAVVCDLCGARDRNGLWSTPATGSRWPSRCEVEVRLEYTVGDGDSGDISTTSYDICPACFRGRLMPWLESQGAKPTVEQRDY